MCAYPFPPGWIRLLQQDLKYDAYVQQNVINAQWLLGMYSLKIIQAPVFLGQLPWPEDWPPGTTGRRYDLPTTISEVCQTSFICCPSIFCTSDWHHHLLGFHLNIHCWTWIYANAWHMSKTLTKWSSQCILKSNRIASLRGLLWGDQATEDVSVLAEDTGRFENS